jgi:hypothetical protein
MKEQQKVLFPGAAQESQQIRHSCLGYALIVEPMSQILSLMLCVVWRCSVPKGPCTEGLVPTLWHYWQVVELLGGGTQWKEVKTLGW